MTNNTVRVEGGLLVGTRSADGAVCAFKGVPYAKAPIGPLRWKPPQPSEPWSGTRPAKLFGPRSIQPNRPSHAVGYFGPEAESEDCLTLNVWTAASSCEEKRPVMVWFHGGAFLVGSGSLPIFDGQALARQGVVLVTVNYRLGRLGFLAHPELSAEQSYRGSGNYGHLDQIEALRWIMVNIAAFGGDPACVTIFGQSAGSTTVNTLMASPLAKGTFHRAIGQSGGSFFARSLATLEVAERCGLGFTRGLGASNIEELRHKPAREIQFARPPGNKLVDLYDSNEAGGIDRPTSWPIVDGYLLKEHVYQTFARGAQHDVPLLTGATADEGSTQPPIPTLVEYERRAAAEYGELAEAFFKLFPANSDTEARQAGRRVVGTRVFNWENWTWARMQAQTGRACAYFYHFSHIPPKPVIGDRGDLSRDIGAFHTAEIPYVFQTLNARSWPWSNKDRELSDTMAAYWVNFAGAGNPNGPGLPVWPRFDPQKPSTLHFNHGVRIDSVPDMATLQFWTAFDRQIRTSA